MPIGRALVLLTLVFCLSANSPSQGRSEFNNEYQSPYKIVLSHTLDELLSANQVPPRDNFRLESKTPHDEWYSERTRKKFGAWGPEPRHYPMIEGFSSKPPEWKRERLLAVAHDLIGLPYQHHHIPDWNPPPDWPWKEVAYGRNSKGMDCSDFTSWVYNYGLGLKLKTGIREQAEANGVAIHEGQEVLPIQKIRDDAGYKSLVEKLVTGDLLYIKHKNDDQVSHVIMWVGKHGQSPDGTPLVIDCTGPDHIDCNGNKIPIGVHLRPFGKDSWYYKSFSHANRIIDAQ